MAKNLTNVMTLVIIGVLFSVFVFAIVQLGEDAVLNPNSNLDDESVAYVLTLSDADKSQFNIQIGNDSSLALEPSGGTNKDYAIEFFDSQSKYDKIKSYTRAVFHMPTFVVSVLLGLEIGDYSFILSALDMVLWAAIFVAGYYFIRKVVT